MQVQTTVPIPPARDAAEQVWRDHITAEIMTTSSEDLAQSISSMLPPGGPPVRLVP